MTNYEQFSTTSKKLITNTKIVVYEFFVDSRDSFGKNNFVTVVILYRSLQRLDFRRNWWIY